MQAGPYYGRDGLGDLRGHTEPGSSSTQSHDAGEARRFLQGSDDLTGVNDLE